MTSLSARVESLEGASREVDAEVAVALGLPQGRAPWAPFGDDCCLPYTASIDAALTLLPEGGWEWNLESEETEMFWPVPSPRTFRCQMGHLITVEAATPALAILAAILKARGL